MPARLAIVGGGMLGVAMARRLAATHEVTIFERADGIGGLAAPWRIGDLEWDRVYHVILESDEHVIALLRELDLDSVLEWKRIKSAFFIGGRLQPFSSARDYLAFDALNWLDKLALLRSVRGAKREDPALDDISVEAWMVRLAGRRVYERIWAPLLRAKLGDGYARASAAFLQATIARLQGTKHAGPARFGYVDGGYATIVRALTRDLARCGVSLRTGVCVESIAHNADGTFDIRANSEMQSFDRVVVTSPPQTAAWMCPSLSRIERDRLANAPGLGVVCCSLVLDRPLGPYYVTNLADARIPFTGIIDMSALVDPRHLSGRGLVYLPRYVDSSEDTYHTGATLYDMAVDSLRLVYPGFDERRVRAFEVARAPYVMPFPECGAVSRMLPIRTSVPGLFIVNSSQIAHATLNVNETLRLAAQATEIVRTAAIQGDGPRYVTLR